MPSGYMDGANLTWFSATGLSTLTSGNAQVVGIAFAGTGTGGVQFFAGVTASASLTPMISFSVTASAVAGRYSPHFKRFPAVVSGKGLTVSIQPSLDPNIGLFWFPLSSN